MGVVYLAEDTRLGRLTALKALPPVFAESDERRERLRREARAAAALSHPSVATVYALEEIDGALFIASEHRRAEPARRNPTGAAQAWTSSWQRTRHRLGSRRCACQRNRSSRPEAGERHARA